MNIQSIFKPVATAVAVAGSLALASAAQAGPKFDVYVGLPGWGYYHGPGYYPYDDYDYIHFGHYPYRLSCYEAKLRVRWAGFRKVKPVDCVGRTYRFHAKKHGEWFVVTVNSRRGHIIGVRELH